ncbi:MAG: hypothetical protein H8E20_02325 [Verrucomicrobia bacterium]|nr:hypothetical protein [Verrucomicrobiota bacterium]
MKRIILAIVGAALGIVVLLIGYFMIGLTLDSFRLSGILPGKGPPMVLGPYADIPWFLLSTIGGIIGFIVSLKIFSRLSKHDAKTSKEQKAEGK